MVARMDGYVSKPTNPRKLFPVISDLGTSHRVEKRRAMQTGDRARKRFTWTYYGLRLEVPRVWGRRAIWGVKLAPSIPGVAYGA